MKNSTFFLAVLMAMMTKAQIPNSGFENWTTVGSHENANGWGTPNDACSGPFYRITKSTDHYPVSVGTYSIRMENNTSLFPSFCAEGVVQTQQGANGTFQFPITGHPTSLTGYYKFAPLNSDTMLIYVALFQSGSQVSSGFFQTFASVSSWTSFNISISSYTTADSASIVLSASTIRPDDTIIPHGNSVLYADNLNFDNLITTGISAIEEQNTITIYPNPTNGPFTLTLPTDFAEITVTNILGKQIIKTQATQKTSTLQLDNNGVYIINAKTEHGTTTRKIIVNQ